MPDPPKYVLQGSFDIDPAKWEAAKDEIRAILIEKAKQRAIGITYSDLVEQIKSVRFSAHDQRLFAILGQISVTEHEQGRPLLSVLVVHKTGDMQPGQGFFELAKALGFDTSNLLKTWVDEFKRVHKYWGK
jgi:hypothetical protein